MSANLPFAIPFVAPQMPHCYSAFDILKIIENDEPMLYRDVMCVAHRHAIKSLQEQGERFKESNEKGASK